MEFIVNDMKELYKAINTNLIKSSEVAPRGMQTYEFFCPQIELKNPINCLAHNDDRKFYLAYAAVEALMLFSNSNDLKYYSFVNPRMKEYSDDNVTLNGAYGFRIREQIEDVVEKLNRDKDSRQATITIYNQWDAGTYSKDVPCTLTLSFFIRDGRLNMVTNMRSNDVVLGMPYDIIMFTTLQKAIANTLGVGLGKYYHRPISLHVYDHDVKIMRLMAGSKTTYKQISVKKDVKELRAAAIKYMKMVDNFMDVKGYGSVRDMKDNDRKSFLNIIKHLAFDSVKVRS